MKVHFSNETSHHYNINNHLISGSKNTMNSAIKKTNNQV